MSGEVMKDELLKVADWANKRSDETENEIREAYNYLGHYALIAAAHERTATSND